MPQGPKSLSPPPSSPPPSPVRPSRPRDAQQQNICGSSHAMWNVFAIYKKSKKYVHIYVRIRDVMFAQYVSWALSVYECVCVCVHVCGCVFVCVLVRVFLFTKGGSRSGPIPHWQRVRHAAGSPHCDHNRCRAHLMSRGVRPALINVLQPIWTHTRTGYHPTSTGNNPTSGVNQPTSAGIQCHLYIFCQGGSVMWCCCCAQAYYCLKFDL